MMVKGVGPVRIQIEALVHRAQGPIQWPIWSNLLVSYRARIYFYILYERRGFLIHIDMYIIYNCEYMYRISLDLIYYGRRLDLLVSKE